MVLVEWQAILEEVGRIERRDKSFCALKTCWIIVSRSSKKRSFIKSAFDQRNIASITPFHHRHCNQCRRHPFLLPSYRRRPHLLPQSTRDTHQWLQIPTIAVS